MLFLEVRYYQLYLFICNKIQTCIFFFLGATLLFDVELMGINQAPPPQNVFKQIDLDADNQLSKEEVSNGLTFSICKKIMVAFVLIDWLNLHLKLFAL